MIYLKAVKAAGTIDADKVMGELKKPEINDMFTYCKVLKVMNGEEAFGPITGLCQLAPK